MNPRKNLGATNISWIHQTKFRILVSIPTWNFEKGEGSGIQQIKNGKKRKKSQSRQIERRGAKDMCMKDDIHGGKQCKYYR